MNVAGPEPKPDALQRHYTPQEVAEIWKLHVSTILRMFRDEPGVLRVGETDRRNRRDYVTLRIPESVLQRVHQRKTFT